ncbi:MAG: efflux RND transporter periplasmic adaptor subunit, partial [Syntrophorhabdaceae bacterium]|nr:efflux RND transporter periplasmic adaptor subunit [Syntrophorhabdaceae bacterium]
MNKMRAIIIGCIVVIASLAVAYTAARFADRSGTHENHAQSTAPSSTSSPPAPEAASSREEAPAVEIPVEKQQLIGVRTAVASVVPLQRVVRTVGRIEYDERRLTTVNTKVEGWIERLYVNYTGTYVKKGDRIADIYSPELWATQQEFI